MLLQCFVRCKDAFYDVSGEVEKEMLFHFERACMEVKVFVVLFLHDVWIDLPFIILIYLY